MNVLWRQKTRQIKRCFLAADLHTKDEPIMHQLSTLVSELLLLNRGTKRY